MNSRNLVRFLFTTLILGGITAGLIGLFARWGELEPLLGKREFGEFFMTLLMLVGLGLLFSVISQLSFFAYLTVHRLGLGIFGTAWNGVQIVLIAFLLFDLIYFAPIWFGDKGDRWMYAVYSAVLLIVGLAAAWYKVNLTNKRAFVPAVFFMTVVTVIEWVPVLRTNDKNWMLFMLIPLLVCNAYQLLTLGSFNARSQREVELK
ncbi:KinB-signaling pathway activation protein [Peribacillus kribbensis]|uniref:KinB-signaling pathway activation protein n=1 Tax=Peribacillus kribbensis TaxID=356658 RepID=UPI00040D45BE|nr:KinB-signaling pathway activation protein [Peribacillus kribbensis]